MKVDPVTLAYFSPTGTTKKVLESIAGAISAGDVQHIDLTRPEVKNKELSKIEDGLVILGAPVYAGRIPAEAEERLKRLRTNGVPAVVVVVYGNREYDDALIELRDIAVELGFKPVAGGAFIGEHSFTSDETPLAVGRPDEQDLEKAGEFGRAIREKMKGIGTPGEILPLSVPGNTPYHERHEMRKEPPITDESLCMKCATCIGVCPTAAISINGEVVTDAASCILCCACVKSCPTNARIMNSPMVKQIVRWIRESCRERKEPAVFID